MSNQMNILVDKAYEVLNGLNAQNGYIDKFTKPKGEELRGYLIKYYPEQISDYDNALETFVELLAKKFESKSSGVSAENDDKKKQIMM